MSDSAAKKLAEALKEMAEWAATGRDHYGMIFDPAWKLAEKLRSAKEDDPNLRAVVSKAFQEMGKPRPYLRQIASGFEERYKKAEQAKAVFEKAAKSKKG
jgi:hypothetical protein